MTVNITTRAGKGAPLTFSEVDGNFTALKAAVEALQAALVPTATLELSFNIATDEMTITTDSAGTLVWIIGTATTATAAQIIAGTGATLNGTINTLPGTNTAFIDTTGLTSGVEYFFHAVLTSNGTQPISPARSVRVQQAATTTYATINPLTGSPTIYNYTDANGTWRAYEWTQNGSFEVTAAGDVDYLMVGGGGGGGAWSTFTAGGGGGAGGLLSGTELFLALGSQSITIGEGGLGGRISGPQRQAVNGGNTVALGFTAIGGGYGGARDTPINATEGNTGGSGGGSANNAIGTNKAGTSGQGNQGGWALVAAGSGGGGAGAAGQNAPADGDAGNGGAGIQSSITGTAKFYAGGGGGSGSTVGGLGGSGVGGNGANSSSASGANGAANTGSGGGGGGRTNSGDSNAVGGNGAAGVFIIRVKLA